MKVLGNVTGEVSFLQDVIFLDLSEGATLLYQSGIEFFALTSETLAALRQLLADLAEAPASA